MDQADGDVIKGLSGISRLARESERQVAALAERGLAPAPSDNVAIVGTPDFSISLTFIDAGGTEFRMSLGQGSPMCWGEPWPHHGAFLEPRDLVLQVTRAWPVVSPAYSRDGAPGRPGTAILAPVASRGRASPLVIEHDGRHMTLRSGDTSKVFGSESVLVAQALMTVADILCSTLVAGSPEADGWMAARAAADLPPATVIGDGAPDLSTEETDWSARHAGTQPEAYLLAAVDVQSRQVLHMEDGVDEPDPGEWDPMRDVPPLDRDVVMARAARAASVARTSPAAFVRDCVSARNMDVFHAVYYRRAPH